MRHDLGTASAWLVIHSLSLTWQVVPLAWPSGVPYHLFIALGPSGHTWPLTGLSERLPPGWLSARGRDAIRTAAELEAS